MPAVATAESRVEAASVAVVVVATLLPAIVEKSGIAPLVVLAKQTIAVVAAAADVVVVVAAAAVKAVLRGCPDRRVGQKAAVKNGVGSKWAPDVAEQKSDNN